MRTFRAQFINKTNLFFYFTVSLIITYCIPREGKHARGRQKARWADGIKKFEGIAWLRISQGWVH